MYRGARECRIIFAFFPGAYAKDQNRTSMDIFGNFSPQQLLRV